MSIAESMSDLCPDMVNKWRVEELLALIRRVTTVVALLAISILLIRDRDIFYQHFLQLGTGTLVLLVMLWAALASFGPLFVILCMRRELRDKYARIYYAISINRLLARYIPGGIWMFVGKGLDMKAYGVNGTVIKGLFIFEVLMPAISALVISLFVLYFFIEPVAATLITGIVLSVLGVICYFSVKLAGFEPRGGHCDYLRGLGVFVGYWSIAASIFGYYISGIDESCGMLCGVQGGLTWVLSWLCGYLVLIVPQGILVSETVFALTWPKDAFAGAVTAVVGFRFIILLGDVVATIANKLGHLTYTAYATWARKR